MNDLYFLGIKALVTNSKKEILLLKVSPREIKNYAGQVYWDLPGGRVERGSNVDETLRREIEEETGIKEFTIGRHVGTVLSPFRIPDKESDMDYGLMLRIYEATVADDVAITLSHEHTEYKWVGPTEAAELLASKYPEEFLMMIRGLGK